MLKCMKCIMSILQHDNGSSQFICVMKRNGCIVGSDSRGMWRLALLTCLLIRKSIVISSYIQGPFSRQTCEMGAVMICCVICRCGPGEVCSGITEHTDVQFRQHSSFTAHTYAVTAPLASHQAVGAEWNYRQSALLDTRSRLASSAEWCNVRDEIIMVVTKREENKKRHTRKTSLFTKWSNHVCALVKKKKRKPKKEGWINLENVYSFFEQEQRLPPHRELHHFLVWHYQRERKLSHFFTKSSL